MGVFLPKSIVGAWIIQNKLPDAQDRLDALKKLSLKWDKGEIDYPQFEQFLSQYTEIPANKIWSTLFENVWINQELIDFVKTLKSKYQIALLSNSPDKNARRMLKHQQLEQLFDQIIISAEHGLAKPDPQIYKLTLKLTHSQASQVVFVDDRQENIQAAEKLGIKSFLFTDNQTLKKDLNFLI